MSQGEVVFGKSVGAEGAFYSDIGKCARCGNNHNHVLFRKIGRPPMGVTHFALCPTTGEPILLNHITGPGA